MSKPGPVPIFLLAVFCGTAFSDDAVVVKAVREPVAKSYRKMVEGVELFENRRHLAPAASLRFRLLPRKVDTAMEGVELEIAADSKGIPLAIAHDRTFALARDPNFDPIALEENARVMPNRKAGTMTWRADVRTPGLPPNVRRLGDLRLECEVGMKTGLVSIYGGLAGLLDELFPSGPEYCRRALPRYLFFAERPVWSVTLVDGERREVLRVDRLYGGATRDRYWKEDLKDCDCETLLDRTYFAPLGDQSWPDDTLVEIEYMSVARLGLTKAEVKAKFGNAAVVDFPSGYEVWVYREKPPAAAELVLLFDAAGVLAKTRVR